VPGECWVDIEADRAAARQLLQETPGQSAAALVQKVFTARSEGETWAAIRTRQVLSAPEQLRADLRGWLADSAAGEVVLDLGCGPGMFLAAAAAEGRAAIGVDISMVWLVAAERLVREYGGHPVLAAALAEALPLADRSVSGAVALDVIEHVADPAALLRELDRVVAPGGTLALATPNRFSLAAEPHVFVWGVGWVPRRFQKRYVKWRSGKDYEFVRMLDTWEATRLLRRHTQFQFALLVPPVPEREIAHFSPGRARLARAYNRLVARKWLNSILLRIGPFFRIVGRKPEREHKVEVRACGSRGQRR
jgi:SAM-dependent methyltransferase